MLPARLSVGVRCGVRVVVVLSAAGACVVRLPCPFSCCLPAPHTGASAAHRQPSARQSLPPLCPRMVTPDSPSPIPSSCLPPGGDSADTHRQHRRRRRGGRSAATPNPTDTHRQTGMGAVGSAVATACLCSPRRRRAGSHATRAERGARGGTAGHSTRTATLSDRRRLCAVATRRQRASHDPKKTILLHACKGSSTTTQGSRTQCAVVA